MRAIISRATVLWLTSDVLSVAGFVPAACAGVMWWAASKARGAAERAMRRWPGEE